MQSADLQACLGFLQAIHYSAKVANVNKEVCQSLSRVVGRIRPCLEEVDMADNGEQHNSSLCMIESSLESIQVAIGRFSTMGYLQSVLEAQAMCDNFSKSRDTMIKALENLAESRKRYSTKDWRDDVQRICELLKGLRFEDCDHLQVAKRVHETSRQIIEGEISVKSGQVIIRSQLLANRSIGPKAMQEEIQGLERELSRARVEKQQHEVEELLTIIRALKQSSSDSDQDSRPQPPVEYLCPISQRIMKDPVVLVETGQTYDRKYIEEWFGRGNRTCPATKQTVTELHLTPNYALKSLASSWVEVNRDGDDDEDENDVIFHRSSEPTETIDSKKGAPMDDVKKIVASCMNGGGYSTMIECGYSTMDIPTVSQALTSTSSSADSTSLKSKKGIESVGASRESYSGKQNTTQREDLSAKKQHEAIHAMQTANVVNSLATSNTSMNLGGRQGAAMAVPSLASKFAFAKLLNSKRADFAETRSTDQYEPSTPRSTYSELPKRMNSVDSMSLSDTLQRLKAARRLQFELDNEELTPRSTRSTNKMLFRTDKAAQFRNLQGLRGRRTYPTPSVYSAASKQSQEAELRQYEELEKLENESEADSDQQATDEAEEDWLDNGEFDAASLTTIGSHAPRYPSSIASTMRPAAKKGAQICTGFMQGATNVLFGDHEDLEEDGNSSVAEEEDSNDISLPVLADMLKTNDLELAASLASNLAFKAQTDPVCIQDIPRLNIIPSLVKLLVLPSDAVKSAAARALGVIGERSPEAKLQIINCGAISVLGRLNKNAEESQDPEKEEGSLEDVAGATRFALSALNSTAKDTPSIDVSPQMLVELLMSHEEDLQSSAVLELLEKLSSVYADVVLKELTQSDVLLSLVDCLEGKDEDVQFAAAEILSRMIFHDQKTQIELSQSIGIVSKLLRLIKQEESSSCKSAAAQVIRGLAHNNSRIREDVLRRGVIPEFASLLCSNDTHTRETAAWMLGIMASHSQVGQDEVSSCDQAMFMLEELSENGMAQEKVAAKFALRALSDEGVGCDDELSSPIVIHSLEVGTKEVRIAAAWELCRMASSNQWSQIEIYECGGVTALLGYLKARPRADGVQACLATLVKLASNEARIAAQISQEGGVYMAVRLLKSPATPDKKLVIELLTLLAEKCPLHQQEVVSNGAVPVLVDLLFSEEVICTAAFKALSCLLDNDLSVIPTSVAECAAPTLLDIVANSESPSFSKKAAVQLLGKMGEAAFDSQQVVIQQGGIDILMEVMQCGDDPDVMLAAAQAMKSLSNKRFRDQGRGTIPKLVQVLETSVPGRKPRTPGLVQMGDFMATSQMTTSSSYGSSSGGYSSDYSSRPTRRPSAVPPLALPVVPESVAEESEVEEADDTQSATIQEAPESPLSRTTYEPTPKKTPFAFDVCTNDAFSDCPESVVEEPKQRSIAPSVASSARRAPSIRAVEQEPRKVSKGAHKKGITHLQNIVENIKADDGHATHRTAAAIGELRNLVSTNRHMGSHLLKTGAVGLLIDRLRSQSYR